MSSLVQLFPDADLPADVAEREVTGVTADSRTATAGVVFVAVAGVKADGLGFARDAVAKGAVAVAAASRPADLPAHVAFVPVPNARAALAGAAARFYPRQPATIVAVTGTSGKTSVVAFTRQIWLALGRRAASIGTLGVVAPAGEVYAALTTPDPVTLHAALDTLARGGIAHLALEASSHGLDQHRLDGVRLAAGAFTNLSRDHLDYHPSIEAYLAAKLRLFEVLLTPGQPAVVDADGEVAARVVAACEGRGLQVITTGEAGRDLRLMTAEREGLSTRLAIRHGGRTYGVLLPLLGRFQVANALVAAGLCIATGSQPGAVFEALAGLQGAPGRLELIGDKHGAPVFVDYAHKPDALEKALQVLRPLTAGRLIVVFGAGGDRDAGKRPLMGAIAVRYADLAVVTDDNPRSENPAAIRAAILAAAPGALEIGDRAAAIRHAVAALGPGDTLLVAGKGHETGQIVGLTVLPFSDADTVRAALGEPAR